MSVDGGAQNAANGAMDTPNFTRIQGIRVALGVNPRPKQGLVDVNVAKTADQPLVEQHWLDLARAPSQTLLEPTRRECPLKRLTAKFLLELAQRVFVNVDDTAKLALIRKPQIETVVELDGQMLETQRRLVVWHRAQPAGHAQVNNDCRFVVEIDDQVLRSPPDALDDAALDAGEHIFGTSAGKHPGKIADVERVNT